MHIDIWLQPEDVENIIKKALAYDGYQVDKVKAQIDQDGNYTGFLAETQYKVRNTDTYDRDR